MKFIYEDGHVYFEGHKNSDKYISSSKYELKDENIKRVIITWMGGEVNLSFNKENKVFYKEISNKKLEEDTRAHYLVDGDTFYLQFVGSKLERKKLNHLNKTLNISLPECLLELKINLASSDLNVEDEMRASSLKINSVSGDINLNGISDGIVKINSVSGDINLGKIKTIYLKTDTVSGDIVFLIDNKEGEYDLSTVSGDCNISILNDAGYDVDFSKVSGTFKSTYGPNFRTKGDGKNLIKFNTISGDLNLNVK